MIGFMKKDLYYWNKGLVSNLFSIFLSSLCMIFFIETNLFVLMGPIYMGSNILGSPRRDKYNGWDAFAAGMPTKKYELAKSKYILYFIIIIISVIIFSFVSIISDFVISKVIEGYRIQNGYRLLILIAMSLSTNFISGAITFPGNYYLDAEKSSIIHSASYLLFSALNYLFFMLSVNSIKGFDERLLIVYSIIIIVISILIYLLSWFLTKRIVMKKEY